MRTEMTNNISLFISARWIPSLLNPCSPTVRRNTCRMLAAVSEGMLVFDTTLVSATYF